MNNSKYILLLLTVLFLYSGCKKKTFDDKWELTFSEEFSADTIDWNTWAPRFAWGQQFNSPDQAYLIDSACTLKDGILSIEARRQSVTGVVYTADYKPVNKQYDYTTGMLYSRNSFSQLYGYFETRARIPQGEGFNAAFWLMVHNSWPPEIDIFEILGREPNILRVSNHFTNNNGEHKFYTKTINGADFSRDFHVFAIEWNPSEIIWYLDGEKVYRGETAVPNQPMFILLNLGVGGDFFGYVTDKTPMPARFEIDYVRVYKSRNQ